MPRKPGIPSLRRHRPSGLGVITLSGKDHYCGRWPEGQADPPPAVRAEADRLVALWLAGGRRPLGEAPAVAPPAGPDQPPSPDAGGCSVAELILAFVRQAERHYRREDGSPTSELSEYRRSLSVLNALFGELDVSEFGPLKLKAVREHMVRRGWSRGVVNQRVGRVVRAFKWGVAEELVPAPVHQALRAVPGLQRGRTEARETEPVRPVPEADVLATLPYLTDQIAGAVRFQLLTGTRPGEALAVRLADLDRSGAVWVYRPGHHKTRHRGKERLVAVGPRAQAVLLEHVRLRCPLCGVEGRPPRIGCRDGALCGPCADRQDEAGVQGPWPRVEAQDPDACLFSPAAWRRERDERATSRRKARAARPRRKPGGRYGLPAYNSAIDRACGRAGVAPWHPHQLRHARATAVRAAYGLEAAQVVLGHDRADVTQVYAERDAALALRVARETG